MESKKEEAIQRMLDDCKYWDSQSSALTEAFNQGVDFAFYNPVIIPIIEKNQKESEVKG